MVADIFLVLVTFVHVLAVIYGVWALGSCIPTPHRTRAYKRARNAVGGSEGGSQVIVSGSWGRIRKIKPSGNTLNRVIPLTTFTAVEVSHLIQVKITVDPAITGQGYATITADSAIADLISVSLRGDVLEMGVRGNFKISGSTEMRVEIKTPKAPQKVSTAGLSTLEINKVCGQRVSLKARGLSHCIVGEASAQSILEIACKGNSDIKVGAASSQEMITVRAHGMGNVYIDNLEARNADVSAKSNGLVSVDRGKVREAAVCASAIGTADLEGLRSEFAQVKASSNSSVQITCIGTVSAHADSMGDIIIYGKPANIERFSSSGMGSVRMG